MILSVLAACGVFVEKVTKREETGQKKKDASCLC